MHLGVGNLFKIWDHIIFWYQVLF